MLEVQAGWASFSVADEGLHSPVCYREARLHVGGGWNGSFRNLLLGLLDAKLRSHLVRYLHLDLSLSSYGELMSKPFFPREGALMLTLPSPSCLPLAVLYHPILPSHPRRTQTLFSSPQVFSRQECSLLDFLARFFPQYSSLLRRHQRIGIHDRWRNSSRNQCSFRNVRNGDLRFPTHQSLHLSYLSTSRSRKSHQERSCLPSRHRFQRLVLRDETFYQVRFCQE